MEPGQEILHGRQYRQAIPLELRCRAVPGSHVVVLLVAAETAEFVDLESRPGLIERGRVQPSGRSTTHYRCLRLWVPREKKTDAVGGVGRHPEQVDSVQRGPLSAYTRHSDPCT